MLPPDATQSLHRHLPLNEASGPNRESPKLDFLSLLHKDFPCLPSLFSPSSCPGRSVLPGCPTHGVRLISKAQSPRKMIPRFFWWDEHPVTVINTAKQKTTPIINIVLWGSVLDTSTSLSDKKTVSEEPQKAIHYVQKRHFNTKRQCLSVQ